MASKRIAVGALFGLLSLAVVGAGGPALAQDRGKSLDHHNADVQNGKYAGWQRTRNGSWVQPVGDPRYPGASPSGGRAVMTKDDMDADAFKPARMINPYGEETGRERGSAVVYYGPSDTGVSTYEYSESPSYTNRPADDGGRYVDNGSVYSQESSTAPRF